MAYPLGVVTRSIIVGDSLTVESGTDLTVRATLRSSRGLVWVATGERAVSAPEVKESAAAGDAVTFAPPVTNQSGWRDLATGALIDVSAPNAHTHTYTIELVTRRGERPVDRRIIGPFPLPTGDGSPVDADLLIEADTVPGLLVSVPDALTPRMDALESEVSDLGGSIPAAVADYLTANPPSAAPDATTGAKGIVKLAGDLAGTADLPTVPGLASKVETTDPRLSDARTPTAHMHDDRYYTEAETDALLAGKAATGHTHTGVYAPALGADDNYVTDAEKAALHTHPAVIAQGATAAAARTAIGAGTSSFSGAYADLSGKPTLGTAAATAATAYATAAQGAKADTALQPATGQAINAQTGTAYTLQASDAGKVVTLTNAAAITLTVPGNVFTTGQRVDCIVLGAGMVTAVGSSCTVNGTPSLVSRAQWSAFTVLFTSATTAIVIGDLA